MNIEKNKIQSCEVTVKEIGSEFWIDSVGEAPIDGFPKWLTTFGNPVLTSSGRGAITLILQQIVPTSKSVLLPAYICESVILPFIEQGYTCYFYELNDDLSPNIDSLVQDEQIGVFVHMGYYGFPTNANVTDVLNYFKKRSTIIIEDVTHTLFSSFERFEQNDFYVGSIRKWFGIPSGGFAASPKREMKAPHTTNEMFSKLRWEALCVKGQFIESNDERMKESFLQRFSEAEALLDDDLAPYCMEQRSMDVLNLVDAPDLVERRRANYHTLLEGLVNVAGIEPFLSEFSEEYCPMFFPVRINKSRTEIRNELISEKIYCPVHWPIPKQIKVEHLKQSLYIYNTILSIPCDQRYGKKEMERILSVLHKVNREIRK
ncbi:hypothetical protein LC040_15500 [Bacillus tianshenii]|nr:hypothetical protein LC040_15500 [Bacillus tianshenii]